MDETRFYPSIEQFEPEAILLAAGDEPRSSLALTFLHRFSERIICCDSAAETLLRLGMRPMATVGDCDSLSSETIERLNETGSPLVRIDEQETNDLCKAFRYACAQGFRRMLILGATGKREDHTLGNISHLADFCETLESVSDGARDEIRLLSDYGWMTAIRGRARFACRPGREVSIFPTDNEALTLEGLRWPLHAQVLRRWWQATLNETVGDSFEVECSAWTIVYNCLADVLSE